ncbi:MAG: GxxExxY protein [Bacteroidetes bacterium]|nr:GxxExxY protein [Bacteroidota bacterium]
MNINGMWEEPDGFIFKEESYAIRGAIFDVYKELGHGFLEGVYQECLEKEFRLRGIPFSSNQEIRLFYKGAELNQAYKPDFICFNKIIVELKATGILTKDHRAQLFNYLKATKFRLGFLVNFGHFPKVEIERIIQTVDKNDQSID